MQEELKMRKKWTTHDENEAANGEKNEKSRVSVRLPHSPRVKRQQWQMSEQERLALVVIQ
jgi:hypothetical protein